MHRFLQYVYLIVLPILLISLMTQEVQAQVGLDVWTNRGGIGRGNLDGGTYFEGEAIGICVRVDVNVERLKLYIIFPDGDREIIYDAAIRAGTHCGVLGPVGRPFGLRKVIAEAWSGGTLIDRDEVHYNVVGCQTGTYLGIRIIVEGTMVDGVIPSIRVRGWLRPIGVDWGTYKAYCYGPAEHNYIREWLVAATLGAVSLTEISRGVDDQSRTVWSEYSTTLDKLSYSDPRLWILRITDSLKAAGRGFIDEVRVESFRTIWKATPAPTHVGNNYVEWINPSIQAAPSSYEIYLYEIATIRAKLEGIPGDRRVTVFVDGMSVGELAPGQTLEYRVRGLTHRLDVEPKIVQASDSVRYRCLDCPSNVTGDQVTGIADVVIRFVKQYRVYLDAEPRMTKIVVDRVQRYLPFADWWDEGSTHTLSVVDTRVVSEQKERDRIVYVFKGWRGGAASMLYANHSITVTASEPISLTAYYERGRQYLVTASTKYGDVRGVGWYDEGSKAKVSLFDLTPFEDGLYGVLLDSGTRAVFLGWRGDAVGDRPEISIVVDGPKELVAGWKLQHFVRVSDPLKTAGGSGWYDSDSLATVSVPNRYVYQGEDVRWVFISWGGDCPSQCTMDSITFKVVKPMDLNTEWEKQYRVRLTSTPETLVAEIFGNETVKWIEENGLLTTEVPYEIYKGGTKYTFKEWAGITTARRLETRIALPMVLRVVYDTWHYVRIVDENAVSVGGGWYLEGQEAHISVQKTSIGIFVKKVFTGWEIDGRIVSQEPTLSYLVNQPTTVKAVWTTDYTELVITILVLGTVIGGTSIYVKKRGLLIKRQDQEIKEKLQRLDEMYRNGRISKEAYERLKQEIQEEMEKSKETLK
jgi:hypothetical protein